MWSSSPFHRDRGRRRAVSRLSERLPRFMLGGEWTLTVEHMCAPEAVTSWLLPNECVRILWSLPCNTSCWVADHGCDRIGICVRHQTRQCRIGHVASCLLSGFRTRAERAWCKFEQNSRPLPFLSTRLCLLFLRVFSNSVFVQHVCQHGSIRSRRSSLPPRSKIPSSI